MSGLLDHSSRDLTRLGGLLGDLRVNRGVIGAGANRGVIGAGAAAAEGRERIGVCGTRRAVLGLRLTTGLLDLALLLLDRRLAQP
jgi:hypothetical protein